LYRRSAPYRVGLRGRGTRRLRLMQTANSQAVSRANRHYRAVVTVVIAVPGYEPWKVAGWAYRMLAERATPLLDRDEDRLALVQAGALNGLHLDNHERAQAARIANGLERAADDLRAEPLSAPDERDREFADALGDLALMLSDMTTAGG
jgi:hypothetical protein